MDAWMWYLRCDRDGCVDLSLPIPKKQWSGGYFHQSGVFIVKTGQVWYNVTRLCKWISNAGPNHLVHVSLHTGQTLPGDFRVASSWVISHSRDSPTQQSFSKVSNFGSRLDSEMDGCWGGFLTWSNGQIRDFVGELEGFAVIWMFDSFDSMIFIKRKRGSELYAKEGLVLDLLNYCDLIRGWNDLQWKAERNNSVGVRFEIPLDTSCRLHGFVMICSDWLLRSWPSSSSWVWCHLQSLLLSLMYLPLQLSPASPNKDANLCGAHTLRHEQDNLKGICTTYLHYIIAGWLFLLLLLFVFDFIRHTCTPWIYTRAFHQTMGREMQIGEYHKNGRRRSTTTYLMLSEHAYELIFAGSFFTVPHFFFKKSLIDRDNENADWQSFWWRWGWCRDYFTSTCIKCLNSTVEWPWPACKTENTSWWTVRSMCLSACMHPRLEKHRLAMFIIGWSWFLRSMDSQVESPSKYFFKHAQANRVWNFLQQTIALKVIACAWWTRCCEPGCLLSLDWSYLLLDFSALRPSPW